MTTTAKTEKPDKKVRGLKCWLKIVSVVLVLVLAFLLGKLYLVITARPTISIDYVHRYSEFCRGVAYRISEDPNSNAAKDYKRAFGSLSQIPWDFRNHVVRKRSSELDEKDKEVLRNLIDLNRQCCTHLERATAKLYCWYEMTSPPASNGMSDIHEQLKMKEFFESARVVGFKIRLLLAEGDFEEALEQVAVFYGIAGHYGQLDEVGGLMLSKPAVHTGFTVLDEGQFESSSLAAFQNSFEQLISRNQKELSFQADRLLAYDVIQRVFTDNGRGNGFLIPRKAVEIIKAPIITTITPSEDEFEAMFRDEYRAYVWIGMFGPDRRSAKRIVDEYFDYIDKVKNLTLWQLHDKGIEPDAHLDRILTIRFMDHFLPDIEHILEMYQQCRTSESAFITTIAILRYAKDKGQLPEKLDDLVAANYLKKMPMDTCSDKPLVYRKSDAAFTLYSVGKDFVDGGGIPSEDQDEGDWVYWPVPVAESKSELPEFQLIQDEENGTFY